ncbi:hypothetical protein MMPV_003405 [Pyropia vietnamensis]
MELSSVIPWGRTAEEYERMFGLSRPTDLRRRVLGVADGPASFNAEWTAAGGTVLSVDPLYAATSQAIASRYAEVRTQVLAAVAANSGAYVWGDGPGQLRDLTDMADRRDAAMAAFAADFDAGRRAGRYIPGSLPSLPLPTDSTELALVSHFLFLYSREVDEAAHVAAVDELLRVAPEARIFPLLTLAGDSSPHLGAVVRHAEQRGWAVRVERVAYEVQRDGNQMLIVSRRGGATEGEGEGRAGDG